MVVVTTQVDEPLHTRRLPGQPEVCCLASMCGAGVIAEGKLLDWLLNAVTARVSKSMGALMVGGRAKNLEWSKASIMSVNLFLRKSDANVILKCNNYPEPNAPTVFATTIAQACFGGG